jgi:hypothetical protein
MQDLERNAACGNIGIVKKMEILEEKEYNNLFFIDLNTVVLTIEAGASAGRVDGKNIQQETKYNEGLFETEIKADFFSTDPKFLSLFNQMTKQRFLVMLTNSAGVKWLFGYPKAGKFTFEYLENKEGAQYTLTFTVKNTIPPKKLQQ